MKEWVKRLVSNDNTISYEAENYGTDKKDKVQQFFRDVKNKLKNTFTNTIYTPLTFYEFHMIDHLYKLVKEVPLTTMSQAIAYEPYIPNFLNILSFTKEVVST